MSLKKTLSISLAYLLLLSNSGLMYSTHYCFGRKVKSGFTQDKNAMNCLMAYRTDSSSHCDKQSKFQNKSCCNNEFISIETDSKFRSSQVELKLTPPVLLTLFIHTYSTPYFLESDSKVTKPYTTPPPIVKPDYQSAHQVYLI